MMTDDAMWVVQEGLAAGFLQLFQQGRITVSASSCQLAKHMADDW